MTTHTLTQHRLLASLALDAFERPTAVVIPLADGDTVRIDTVQDVARLRRTLAACEDGWRAARGEPLNARQER